MKKKTVRDNVYLFYYEYIKIVYIKVYIYEYFANLKKNILMFFLLEFNNIFYCFRYFRCFNNKYVLVITYSNMYIVYQHIVKIHNY